MVWASRWNDNEDSASPSVRVIAPSIILILTWSFVYRLVHKTVWKVHPHYHCSLLHIISLSVYVVFYYIIIIIMQTHVSMSKSFYYPTRHISSEENKTFELKIKCFTIKRRLHYLLNDYLLLLPFYYYITIIIIIF